MKSNHERRPVLSKFTWAYVIGVDVADDELLGDRIVLLPEWRRLDQRGWADNRETAAKILEERERRALKIS